MANAAPLAPTLTGPDDNSYAVVSEPIVFTWVFNDPGDIQSRGDLRYRKPGDADWTTLTAAATFASTYSMPAATLVQPFTYEWQARTGDSITTLSPWSASSFFNTIAVVPAPTITQPSAGATPAVNPILVTWTLPAGFDQDAYLVQVGRNATPYDLFFDSGTVKSLAQSVLATVAAAPVGTSMFVRVQFTYRAHFALATVLITNGILPPEVPLLVLEQTPDKPEVVVSITNPAASDAGHLDTVANDLTRDGVPIAKDLAPDATFTDRKVGGGEVDYVVTARTALGGTATSF